MIRDGKSTGDPVRSPAPDRGSKRHIASKPRYLPNWILRSGRYLYAVLAMLFVLGVAMQVFLAGVGTFGADWTLHTTFVHFLELALPLMFVASFVGWTPWRLTLAPVGLWALITAQYAFAYGGGPVLVSSLHAANALVIFSVSVLVARSAYRITLNRRRIA